MSKYKIKRLPAQCYSPAMLFIEKIFHKEQNIPKKSIPVASEDQYWWCIQDDEEIIGTVAAWKENEEWHWGRLAVHQKLRGLGMGRKLVTKSLNELFQKKIQKLNIDE